MGQDSRVYPTTAPEVSEHPIFMAAGKGVGSKGHSSYRAGGQQEGLSAAGQQTTSKKDSTSVPPCSETSPKDLEPFKSLFVGLLPA